MGMRDGGYGGEEGLGRRSWRLGVMRSRGQEEGKRGDEARVERC